jgi:peptidyl-prolyl cis-trans isomerase SurA
MLIINKPMNLKKLKKKSTFKRTLLFVFFLEIFFLKPLVAQGLRVPGLNSGNISSSPSNTAGSSALNTRNNSTSSKTGLVGNIPNGDESLGVAGSTIAKAMPAVKDDPEYSDFIVAIVDSEPITNREVNLRANEHLEQIRQQGVPQPPRETLLSKTLEELIIERAQLQLALQSGITVTEEEVLQTQIGIAERNAITLEQLYAQVRRQGQSVEQYKSRLRQQMILQRLREREVIAKVKITDLEADEFLLEQAKKGAQNSALVNLSQILIAVPEEITDAQLGPYQAKANEILQKLKSGEDFSSLAKTYSEALDSKNGGVMDLRPESKYPSLFINSIKGVKPGQIVGPIRSGAGLHILKLVERRQGSDENAYVTQTHARHILLRPGGQLSQNAARAKLTDFKLRIERGQADFESLAKEYSQDASASAGGDLGWASTGQFVPEFEAAMAKLSPGQIADPLVTRFGVHLIQVLERKQAALSQKERREAARKVLQDKKFEESYINWERELRGHAFIEYKESPI